MNVVHPIVVQPHALHKHAERFPACKTKADRLRRDVRDALEAGRLSITRPAGLTDARDHRSAITLYAWTADGGKVYCLHTTPSSWVVMTVMRPLL